MVEEAKEFATRFWLCNGQRQLGKSSKDLIQLDKVTSQPYTLPYCTALQGPRDLLEELTYQADTPIKRTALWGWT